jgi:N-acetylglucosamine-6-phosphate deacetylase
MGCVRQAVKYGIPLEDAVRAASYNPAQAIKIDDRAGSLEIGKEASVILLDQETLEIREILFKGARVER